MSCLEEKWVEAHGSSPWIFSWLILKNSNLFKIECALQIYQVVIASSKDTSSLQALKCRKLINDGKLNSGL